MDNIFFSRFHPRIINVVLREQSFWSWDKQQGLFVFYLPSTSRRNFMFAFEGEGNLEADDVSHAIVPGTFFYFRIGSKIRLTTKPNNPLRFYSVHYNYVLLDWEGDAVTCVPPEEPCLPLPPVLQAPDIHNTAKLMGNLYELWRSKHAGYEWKSRLVFQQVLDEAIMLHTQSLSGNHVYSHIKICMDYIKKNYAEPLERETLAEIASLSPSYFSTVFKQVAGYTPTQYITNIRLDQAKQLLQNTGMTICEVARQVGFQDPLYFGRVFANHTGLPPREFRKI
ncbi:MAG: AraC family transcriptional regulator [Paenibacillaceae bacterium]|jgi:AraC-like DNA-binding protein|nr:AraC family transcriptional regulator [Paenibacillaceae bacterium]